MSQALVSPADCCAPCNEAPITQIPGPKGDPGTCDPCSDGLNAFTATTDSFEMPFGGNVVSVEVADSVWASVGQVVYVSGAGYFAVDNIADSTHLGLANLDYPGNAAPTTIIASIQTVSPGGLQGPTGSTPPSDTLNDLSPTTTKGDILADNGANGPDASLVRLGVGTDGQLLVAQSSQATGLQWESLLPNGATDNILPRFNDPGATAEPSPLQASGLLVTDDGALQSTPTGGNARGSKAIDLQVDRVAATQVASGTTSVLSGGSHNTASGTNSTIGGGSTNIASGVDSTIPGGVSNTASAIYTAIGGGNTNVASAQGACVAGGEVNTASALDAAVPGGSGNTASAQSSTCLCGQDNIASAFGSATLGGASARANQYGQLAHAHGSFVSPGDVQFSDLLWWGVTTTDTANVEMFLDGSAIRATVPSDTTWAFQILAVGRAADSTSAVFKVEGGIKNNGGVVTLVAAITTIVVADGTGASWGVVGALLVDADDPNNALRVRVTGALATNIRWAIHARLVEIATT